MTQEQIFKMIEGHVNIIQSSLMDSIELIYNAAYNEGLEAAANISEINSAANIRKLKK